MFFEKTDISSSEKSTSELFKVIRKNNMEEIKKLLESKIDINVRDLETRETPIVVAIRYDLNEVVDLLLTYRPALSVRLGVNHTIIDLMKVKIKSASSTRKKIILESLYEAARQGNAKEIKKIIELKEININTQDDEGNTPLHLAAKTGKTEVIDLLYTNFTVRNKNNDTPLETAVRHKHVEMIKLLLQKKVNGSKVLMITLEMNEISIFEQLLNSPDGDTLLSESEGGSEQLMDLAVKYGHIEAVKMLLKKNPEIRDKCFAGSPPIYRAIDAKQEGIVNVLFEFEVCFTQKLRKQTPYAYAVTCLTESKDPKEQSDYQSIASRIKELETASESRNKCVNNNLNEILNLISTELKQQKKWSLLKEPKHMEFFSKSVKDGIKNQLKTDTSLRALIINPVQDQKSIARLAQHLLNNIQDHESELILGYIKDSVNSVQLTKVVADALTKFVLLPPQPSEKKSLDFSAREYEEFVSTFESEFDEAFGRFRAIDEGQLVYATDAIDIVLQKAKESAEIIPNTSIFNITVPVSKGISAAITLAEYMRKYYRKKAAERMCHLFSAISPLDRTTIIHFLAKAIAFRYQYQLTFLASGKDGITRFATCAAIRIIDYIVSKDENQMSRTSSILSEIARKAKSWVFNQELASQLEETKTFENVFLDGLAQVTNEYDGERNRLSKREEKTNFWESKALFENTGIIDENGKRWASPECKPKIYGYCYASSHEAQKKRGFTERDKSDHVWPDIGQPWPPKLILTTSETPIHSQKTFIK